VKLYQISPYSLAAGLSYFPLIMSDEAGKTITIAGDDNRPHMIIVFKLEAGSVLYNLRMKVPIATAKAKNMEAPIIARFFLCFSLHAF
jgi:hypothetical protein